MNKKLIKFKTRHGTVEFYIEAKDLCGNEKPLRKTLCQLEKGHKGSHRAVIYWE